MPKGKLHTIAVNVLAANGVGDLSAEQKKIMSDRLQSMIMHATGRQDWYENQRYRYLNISLSLIAAATTLTIVLHEVRNSFVSVSLFFFALAILLLYTASIFIIFKFSEFIEGEYPHRPHADIRSWYFRYNVNGDENVCEQFEKYANSWVQYSTSFIDSCAEDIEEVFVLYIIQNEKSQNLKKTKKIFIIFMFAIIVVIVFGGIVQYCNSL